MLIIMFEVHADPSFAVTTSGLNMPFSKLFSVRWPDHTVCKTRLGQEERHILYLRQSFDLKAAFLSLSYLFLLYLNIFEQIVFNSLFK